MNKIKFAVVGCGHIGKRHAFIIANHPQAELAALIDVNSNAVNKLSVSNVPFFSSLEDFLHAAIETDVVIIATPNGLHACQAIECLNAGKHVVIEKPMALCTHDAQQVIDTAEKNKKHVFIVKQNRYALPVVWLKQVLKDALLGEIFSIQMNCFWNRDERYYTGNWHGTKEMDGGVLFTQFSHFIDIFYWLFGDIRNISAEMHAHKHFASFEDSGIVLFEFGSKGLGCLHFSTAVWNKNFESSITIIAEKGTVKIAGQYMDVIEHCDIKDYTLRLQATVTDSEAVLNHSLVIQNVIDVLQGNAAINTNAGEGFKVVDIIERIYAAGK